MSKVTISVSEAVYYFSSVGVFI